MSADCSSRIIPNKTNLKLHVVTLKYITQLIINTSKIMKLQHTYPMRFLMLSRVKNLILYVHQQYIYSKMMFVMRYNGEKL
jgi:hypothetical protein